MSSEGARRAGPAVRVTGLAKTYQVYASPFDRLKQALWRRERHYLAEAPALAGVEFEIGRGESVGIVGRNGSGKSTLLQIIAGTLQPSAGTVEVNGRLSALLELGSGFNPEFTGRENLYVAGAIQGLTRAEIDGLFAEVAAFADIGPYIERPTKTYSTGMMMRLAFAMAIAVDPDILIVDEALVVGDEAFQRKCLARIEAIREAGATILLVSHSGRQIIEVCSRAILLDRGEKLLEGVPKRVVANYQRLIYAPPADASRVREEIKALGHVGDSEEPSRPAAPPPLAADDGEGHDPGLAPQSTVSYAPQGATIEDLRTTTEDGRPVNQLVRGRRYVIRYRVRFSEAAEDVACGTLIKTTTGVELAAASTAKIDQPIGHVPEGAVLEVAYAFTCRLLPETYFVNAGVSAMVDGARQHLHRLLDGAMFKVVPEPEMTIAGFVDLDFAATVTVATDALA